MSRDSPPPAPVLRALAPAKINLGLLLGPVRPDGRHELVSVYESLSLVDELLLSVVPGASGDQVICPGVTGENLVAAALRGLRARGWAAPPVRVAIAKRIPVASGMAGGSADAAALLRLAAALTPGAPATAPAQLEALAAELGSDVPAQLRPGVSLGTGAGELVRPLAPLAPHSVVILPRQEALATPAVYHESDRLGLPRSVAALQRAAAVLEAALQPGARLPGELLVNDLQPAAVSLLPAVGEALAAVHDAGADHALVCGSGPTVAGLFWEAGEARGRAAAQALSDRDPPPLVARPAPRGVGEPEALSSSRSR